MATANETPLGHLVRELIDCFDPATLKKLIDFRASEDLNARLEELAERNQESQLTTREKDEYVALVDFGSLISLMQAHARERLKESDAA